MKLAEMIKDGTITVQDLASAPKLIERAQFVATALEACKQTLLFPFGKKEIHCYEYNDRSGEYSAWGTITFDGTLIIYCNWGGGHEIGRVDLFNSAEVFMAFENNEFRRDLKRFLEEQIQKAKDE